MSEDENSTTVGQRLFLCLSLYFYLTFDTQSIFLFSSKSFQIYALITRYTTTSLPTSSKALTRPSTVPCSVWQLTTTRKKLPFSPGA